MRRMEEDTHTGHVRCVSGRVRCPVSGRGRMEEDTHTGHVRCVESCLVRIITLEVLLGIPGISAGQDPRVECDPDHFFSALLFLLF